MLQDVKTSCADVARVATHCVIDISALDAEMEKQRDFYLKACVPQNWADGGYHFVDLNRPDLMAKYVMVVDATVRSAVHVTSHSCAMCVRTFVCGQHRCMNTHTWL